MSSSSRTRGRCYSDRRAWVGASLDLRRTADDGCCCKVCALHCPHSFDALRNRYERRIGYALTAQTRCRPDQISGNAVTQPATLDPLSAMLPLPGAPGNPGSDRRKFETNTAISGKQFYLRVHILYLSTRDRCELFQCCALSVPLLASSIITKPDLLPVGFAGLRHLG